MKKLQVMILCAMAVSLGAGCTFSRQGQKAGPAAAQAQWGEGDGRVSGILGIGGAAGGGRAGLDADPIRIGAIYALSGNNAAIGTNILRGIDFAAEEIN